MLKFPEDFFWGAATSAYQVEGNNSNCDWWEWEKSVALKETSGQACRHYQLYKEDFDLAKGLHHNALRLSVEWSRIEPEKGKFSQAEIDHYKDVILSLRERGLEPIVGLHHFTNPLWFAKSGGWQNKNSRQDFLRYTQRIVEALGSNVKYWVTINEPMVYVYHAYILGVWPPQEKSLLKASEVTDNLIIAHVRAYRLIHEIYKRKKWPHPMVSIAKNLQAFAPCNNTLRNKFAVYLRNINFNFKFLDRLAMQRSLDYIGINYYTRGLVDLNGWGIKNFLLDTCNKNHSRLKKNSLGWDIYPEGLYSLLIRLKRYKLPIFILENGICTEDDSLRWDFISSHLKNMHRAMSEGADVIGYIYWSLIDNFEWDKGFGPRFGLIQVDYNTYQRRVRESAGKFAQACRDNRLD